MRYLDEVNAFWDWILTNPDVSTAARVLWFALMHFNNKSGWKREFNVSMSSLELSTGLSKSGVVRARNVLKQCGLISYRVRSGRQSTIYSINYFACHRETQNGTQTDTQTETQAETVADTQDGTQAETIPRIDKTRLDNKESKPKKMTSRFVKPTIDEVMDYCRQRNNQVDANRFVDYYESNGWLVGKAKMKDWRAAVRTWERNSYGNDKRRGSVTETTPIAKPKYGYGEG
ncbi:hypothetical protein [Veillonella sp.]|uniref:hypothetical protein n=1 Tax=Veillonella sp. TaxID=1926307 RepID=UPI0025F08083|nr:hypothetical protein [Veillonella sp.]